MSHFSRRDLFWLLVLLASVSYVRCNCYMREQLLRETYQELLDERTTLIRGLFDRIERLERRRPWRFEEA